jgi:hypothetical protein
MSLISYLCLSSESVGQQCQVVSILVVNISPVNILRTQRINRSSLLTSDYIFFWCNIQEVWLALCSPLLLMPNTSKLGLQDVDHILTYSFWKHNEKLRLVSDTTKTTGCFLGNASALLLHLQIRGQLIRETPWRKKSKWMIRDLKKWVRKKNRKKADKASHPRRSHQWEIGWPYIHFEKRSRGRNLSICMQMDTRNGYQVLMNAYDWKLKSILDD